MQLSEFTSLTGEISIALIGFSAVVIALRKNSGGIIGQFQHRITVLLNIIGIFVFFFSMFPHVLEGFGLEPDLALRISSFSFGSSFIVFVGVFFRYSRHLLIKVKDRFMGPDAVVRGLLALTASLITIAAAIWPEKIPLKGAYMLGLTFQILGAAMVFTSVIWWFWKEDEEENLDDTK